MGFCFSNFQHVKFSNFQYVSIFCNKFAACMNRPIFIINFRYYQNLILVQGEHYAIIAQSWSYLMIITVVPLVVAMSSGVGSGPPQSPGGGRPANAGGGGQEAF